MAKYLPGQEVRQQKSKSRAKSDLQQIQGEGIAICKCHLHICGVALEGPSEASPRQPDVRFGLRHIKPIRGQSDQLVTSHGRAGPGHYIRTGRIINFTERSALRGAGSLR